MLERPKSYVSKKPSGKYQGTLMSTRELNFGARRIVVRFLQALTGLSVRIFKMIEVRRFTISSDAIDNIQTKVDLLKYCHDHNIKVRHHVSETNLCNPNS